MLQPWQSSCGRCSIWIQTTLNHMPLNLMWMASPGALSAPLQSKGSLPSCIQQSGSRAPWRPGTKHTQAGNSFAELLCSVYILSCRNRTFEVKQMYSLQRFVEYDSALLLYERIYSFKQNFVQILVRYSILMQDGIFKVTKDFLLPSPSFLFLHIAHPKPSIIPSLTLWVCLTVKSFLLITKELSCPFFIFSFL